MKLYHVKHSGDGLANLYVQVSEYTIKLKGERKAVGEAAWKMLIEGRQARVLRRLVRQYSEERVKREFIRCLEFSVWQPTVHSATPKNRHSSGSF